MLEKTGKDITDLILRAIELDTKTVVYKISYSQIFKGDAFFEFSDVEKRMEKFLEMNENAYFK